MTLEKSPKLSDYKDGMPEPPVNPDVRRKRFRIIILITLLFVLILGGINFMDTPTAALLTGRGSVQGTIIDAEGMPFLGYIFILGTDLETQTDMHGYFVLDNVPAGEQSLIVADELFGREFPILVVAGETVDVGQIQFVPTATP